MGRCKEYYFRILGGKSMKNRKDYIDENMELKLDLQTALRIFRRLEYKLDEEDCFTLEQIKERWDDYLVTKW